MTRHQWVFLAACGCPFGVTTDHGFTVEEAWREMYDTGRIDTTERAIGRAHMAGVTAVRVDDAEYAATFMPQMLSGYTCPHSGRAA